MISLISYLFNPENDRRGLEYPESDRRGIAAGGTSNSHLTRELQLERGQVRLWPERWLAATPQLATVEAENSSDRKLMALITKILSERTRPGTTNYFSTEQVVQIVALACVSDSNHRIRFVYIPKHTCWLNQIECWCEHLEATLTQARQLHLNPRPQAENS